MGDLYCLNCHAMIPAEAKICPNCGENQDLMSEQEYRDKLLHALNHPLDDVRMRAIIALGLRHEEGTALHLAECALHHPSDVVEGMEIVNSLRKFGASQEGRQALERLAVHHAAHAVRVAAETALGGRSEPSKSRSRYMRK
ncbi:MAG: HEAT repeat domain-containing protein [Burkholderiales bacterium]